jgi:uncharacterized membrane protein YdfJ with MMPL/SSD domain
MMKQVTANESENIGEGIRLSPTARVAGWSARHRWWVVLAAVMTLVLAGFASSTFETQILSNDGGGVGESQIAAELLEERSDKRDESAGVEEQTELLVVSHPTLTVDDPEFRTRVEELTGELNGLTEVQSVLSFYNTGSPEMVSENGHAVLTQVTFAGAAEREIIEARIDAALDVVRASGQDGDGFAMAMTGNVWPQMDEISEQDMSRILLVTMVLGLGIMLLAFRAVVAAVIPLVLAIWAIFLATAIAAVISQVYALDGAYAEMILLMGLAVGIDYSLFIISRFRAERAAGRAKLAAIAVASNTTGRAVFYAGISVVVSLAGLILTNNPIFISLSIAAIVVVLIALIGSLTLLPAILALLGDNVNRLRLPFLGRGKSGGGVWGAIADRVLARPAIFAIVSATALIALAAPAAALNLGFNQGAASLPNAVEAKQAYKMLEEHFTAGLTQPAWIVVDAADVDAPDVQAAVAALIDAVGAERAYSAPFETNTNQAGDLLTVSVPLSGNLEDDESRAAVERLRNVIIPAAFANTTAEAYVTGATAGTMDFVDSMYDKAPYVFGFVLGFAFILMLVMFRSLVIPVKAVLLNLLSVGAAYGVLVMVFQWGWGISFLGSEATGIIMAWLPLFLFGILFGLSMDYHMLLLSRVKEAHDAGASNDESVSEGIKVTAGQITSAAAIMVGVFGAFAMSRMIGMQQFGLGLGVAVLIDATVIRSVLLPATMKLLGDRNWYLPQWLEWLPRVGPEEAAEDAPAKRPVREPQPATGRRAAVLSSSN